MIGFLNGIVVAFSNKRVIIDVNGVGYTVLIPEKMLPSLSNIGSKIKLFTHFSMNPRDGAVELYGFETQEELAFFELLTSISGIGPKSAQSILSRAELQQLQLAILQGDTVYLNKVAGLGPKTSQRLILELKEKIGSVNLGGVAQANISSDSDAMEALVALGYSQVQAREALKQIDQKLAKPEQKITAALKLLAKK